APGAVEQAELLHLTVRARPMGDMVRGADVGGGGAVDDPGGFTLDVGEPVRVERAEVEALDAPAMFEGTPHAVNEGPIIHGLTPFLHPQNRSAPPASSIPCALPVLV